MKKKLNPKVFERAAQRLITKRFRGLCAAMYPYGEEYRDYLKENFKPKITYNGFWLYSDAHIYDWYSQEMIPVKSGLEPRLLALLLCAEMIRNP